MRENGTASERPLDNVILKRMRGFAAMNKLKKEALKVIAAGMSQEEIAGLRTMFKVSTPAHPLLLSLGHPLLHHKVRMFLIIHRQTFIFLS